MPVHCLYNYRLICKSVIRFRRAILYNILLNTVGTVRHRLNKALLMWTVALHGTRSEFTSCCLQVQNCQQSMLCFFRTRTANTKKRTGSQLSYCKTCLSIVTKRCKSAYLTPQQSYHRKSQRFFVHAGKRVCDNWSRWSGGAAQFSFSALL